MGERIFRVEESHVHVFGEGRNLAFLGRWKVAGVAGAEGTQGV